MNTRQLIASLLLSLTVVSIRVTEARFNQENCEVLKKFVGFAQKNPAAGGQMNTFAGQGINRLLAGPDPCEQIKFADEMLDAGKSLFQGADLAEYINVVREYIHCEKNFNPFAAGAAPKICADPALPKNAELRGILPKVDPASGGKTGISGADATAATEKIFQDALAGTDLSGRANGLSIAQQMVDLVGFSDFVGAPAKSAGAAAAAGTPVAVPASSGATGQAADVAAAPLANDPSVNVQAVDAAAAAPPAKCRVTVTVAAAAASATPASNPAPSPNPLASAAPAPIDNLNVATPPAPVVADATGGAGTTPAVVAGGALDAAPAGNAGAPVVPAATDVPAGPTCTTQGMKAGRGLDGDVQNVRFAPVEENVHGSALNIPIIIKAICDKMPGCEAKCTEATNAATAAPKGGAQADAFNAVFGLTTNFATTADPGAAGAQGAAATCTTQGMKAERGLDGDVQNIRFAPVQGGLHGSALNIPIIIKAICDKMPGCEAKCTEATNAATAAPKGGAQADAFNAVFGLSTNFATTAV